nr:MAG TPA: hypothetical protein [Caudoviricetes sp.]DAL38013.1 MAG TPA_asm: hypothetical protein [Caudoviricetes sp.]
MGYYSLHKTKEKQVKRLLFFLFSFLSNSSNTGKIFYNVIVPTISVYI